MGHTFNDVAIDAGSDPEGEHAGVTQMVPDEVKRLFFNRYVTVGGNDYRP
jgi:hypothetical protein